MRLGQTCAAALLALVTLAIAARADPLPDLDSADQRQWTAVGVVNARGRAGAASCSGTLIAPDLVLTAAHCAGKSGGTERQRHFVVGWQPGKYLARRVSVEAHVHPAYGVAQGNTRFRFDVAVLRLDAPFPAHLVSPITPLAPNVSETAPMAVLGYNRNGSDTLAGRFDCPVLPQDTPAILLLGCEVVSGNSGGAVLAWRDDGWHLAGVVVGRVGGENPAAFAVPVGDWILEHWQAAQARAGKSSAPQTEIQ